MITLYHNPSCSKSRATEEFLQQCKLNYVVKNYLIDPPSKEELLDLLQMLSIKPIDLIRKNETIFKELYNGAEWKDEQYLDLMLQHPILIERPIVIYKNKAAIGRPLGNIQRLLEE